MEAELYRTWILQHRQSEDIACPAGCKVLINYIINAAGMTCCTRDDWMDSGSETILYPIDIRRLH
jgi:hypothetical protein